MAKKKNGTSWFTAVKKVLWSPPEKKETDYKKKEKKRWIFPKSTNSVTDTTETEEQDKPPVTVSAVTLTTTPGFTRHHWAAIIVQTAFRGYLARRALRALKGIVKLQALVRGHNVRNQAKLTLRCIKALVRVQDQVLNHHRCYNLEAMFAESNGFSDTKTYLQDIRSRRSLSRDMSRCTKTESLLQKKLEIAVRREKTQALALSNQIQSRSERNQSGGDDWELLERTKWLDQWMARKQWDNTLTNRDLIKTLEVDLRHQLSYPTTPPSCRSMRSGVVRSASPRVPCSPSSMVQPNYMTATESAKAKAQTLSTPRRRPTVKKRLCYAEEDNLRSPSFKSAYNASLWGDHESDYYCCYGKISPCSTIDLRWLE